MIKNTLPGENTHYKKTIGGDTILKQIKVVAEDGTDFESTYLKRAKQLVKKGRAVWINGDTICLTQHQEENIMEDIIQTIEVEATEETAELTQDAAQQERKDYDEKMIREFAKRRLEKKQSLIIQVFDFAVILFVLFLYVLSWEEIFLVIFCMGWGARLLIRILRFAKPSFKDGFMAYFKRRREHSLEIEYDKLMRMGEETLREEMGI